MKTDLWLKMEEQELPALAECNTRCVMAANGPFLERCGPGFATSTRIVGDVPGLAEHFQYCRLTCGKLNRTMHAAMLAFFLPRTACTAARRRWFCSITPCGGSFAGSVPSRRSRST